MNTTVLSKISVNTLSNLTSVRGVLDPFCSFLHPSIVALWYNDKNQALYLPTDRYVLGKLFPIKEEPFWSLASKTPLGSPDLEEAIKTIQETDRSATSIEVIPKNSLANASGKLNSLEVQDVDEKFSDYIYDLKITTACLGGQYEDMRRHVRRFFNLYGKYTKLEIYEGWEYVRKYKKHAYHLFEDWTHYSTEGSRDYTQEEHAFDTFFQKDLKNIFGDIYIVILRYKNKVVAYSINEKIDNSTVMNHFHKANLNLSSISHYMFYSCSMLLAQKGFHYLNFQEDCGIVGLRAFKKKMRPATLTELLSVSF